MRPAFAPLKSMVSEGAERDVQPQGLVHIRGHSSASKVASKRGERNGTQRDGRRPLEPRTHGCMGRTERAGSTRNSRRIRPSGQTSGGHGRGSETQSREKSARRSIDCPSICPSDRRHTATSGDTRRQRAWGRVASDDIARHHATRRIGSPKPQVAGSIPVPPAREPEFMGIVAL